MPPGSVLSDTLHFPSLHDLGSIEPPGATGVECGEWHASLVHCVREHLRSWNAAVPAVPELVRQCPEHHVPSAVLPP